MSDFYRLYSVMFVMLCKQRRARRDDITWRTSIGFHVAGNQTRCCTAFSGSSHISYLGLFLAFQYSWMRNQYGISPGILLIMLGYAAVVFWGR